MALLGLHHGVEEMKSAISGVLPPHLKIKWSAPLMSTEDCDDCRANIAWFSFPCFWPTKIINFQPNSLSRSVQLLKPDLSDLYNTKNIANYVEHNGMLCSITEKQEEKKGDNYQYYKIQYQKTLNTTQTNEIVIAVISSSDNDCPLGWNWYNSHSL